MADLMQFVFDIATPLVGLIVILAPMKVVEWLS